MKTLKLVPLSICLFCAPVLFAQDSTTPPAGKDKEPAKRPATVVINRETVALTEKHYKLIPLGALEYSTVDTICRPWLSEGGALVHEKAKASVLVYDTNAVIEKITKFIGELDRDTVNVRIDVDFIEVGSRQNDSLRVDVDSGLPSHQQLVFENGKWVRPKNIEIAPRINRDSSNKLNSQTVVTLSGYPATLWVGNTMLDPSWLNNLILPPTVIVTGGGGTVVVPAPNVDFKWVDVGSKLRVCPNYLDNGNIEVEVYPEVSFLDGEGKSQTVKVQSLSTKIVVKDGQRFPLGGVVSSDRNKMIKLFGPEFYSNRGNSSILDAYITATAIKPDGRPLKKRVSDGKPGAEQIQEKTK